MRAILQVLLVLTSALPAADNPAPVARKKFSSISLLPDGSKLHHVMFPRYDNNLSLIGVLKVRDMTLVNVDTISGENVTIEFCNADSSPRGRADLTKAVFNQAKGILESEESVIMQSDRINAMGTGLYYAFDQGEGFLIGPATTWLQQPTATPMNSSNSPRPSTALFGMALLTLPLAAAPPPAVTTGEHAAIQADAASMEPVASQSATVARADLTKDRRDAATAAAAANKFVAQAGLSGVDAELPATEGKPLDVKPGPNDTVISCDGGMYFDADEGVFVYFKNVRVTDPRFALSGANELKIFLEKKPAKTAQKPATTPEESTTTPDKPAKKDPSKLALGSKFGEVERIVANGAVRILQKQPDKGKAPIEASGAIFTYHPNTGQIIISGGYPWVKQGTTFMRAKEPNLILRILKTGSFVTEGNWDMGGNIEQKR
ncbi:MAG: hypothetical protein NTV46_20740 [Verrucomicrobia bacterium]|nr:hypothetical protein [Verrucomicrobiota bacterium]